MSLSCFWAVCSTGYNVCGHRGIGIPGPFQTNLDNHTGAFTSERCTHGGCEHGTLEMSEMKAHLSSCFSGSLGRKVSQFSHSQTMPPVWGLS